MVRIESVVEQGRTIRRSNRIAERRRITNLEQQEERMEEHQITEIPIGSQREQGQNNDIDYDRVSVHTAMTCSTEEGQRIENEEPVTAKNLRLQEQRSRSATRSRSRSSRNSHRKSQSNRRNDRRRKHMEVIEENLQDGNLEDQRERRRIVDLENNRYEHPRELRRRASTNFEREEEDLRKGQMILHGREILRDECEHERETARIRDRQRRREELEERELQSGLRYIDNWVRGCKRHRVDDINQGRVIPQER
ncbi:zinc finger CCCH domain-containing protein 13-like [Papaver somniferum]|uniref:zinc finger CCCH domain-containing protein 13-like n=1 Tax=Papaver somniferum TaxID=3469 RepID=UPI000E6FF4E1|nr:zinc finger CCCH domain-containing protein 13-like [Papaver somniferum]